MIRPAPAPFAVLQLAGVLLAVALLAGGCRERPADPLLPTEEERLPVRADHLVFATASYDGLDVAQSARPLIRYLTLTLHVPVQLRVAEPYEELPRLLAEGAVDVAQLAPLPYVRVSREVPGMQPLATVIELGSPTYLGQLYVREDAPYRQVADLKGARIGYVSSRSSSGYLFPRDLLRQKGFEPDTFLGEAHFLGSHPQVLQAVREGLVDVGASFDATLDWRGPAQRPRGLRVLAKTERIPNDCIVARPGLDRGTALALQRALLALRPGAGKEAEGILEALRVNGWVAADEARYDRVRAVLAHEGLGTR